VRRVATHADRRCAQITSSVFHFLLTKGEINVARNETVRISPKQLAQDREVYAAIKGNSKYAPANAAFTQAALDAEHVALEQAEHEAVQTEAAAAAARDKLVAGQWRYHNKMLGAKDQVVAQFGRDSDEASAVGLKKSTEHKRPARKATKGGEGTK
jgi:hypothetical protein